MNLSCLFFLLLGIVDGPFSRAFAQQNVARYSHGLIWKIEKDGVKPSFLLGTMHVSDRRVTHFGKTLEELIARCDSLTLEAKFDLDTQATLFNSMLLQNGKTLDDYISRSEMKIVRTSLMAEPMMSQMVGLLKPWAATLLLSMPKESAGTAMDALLQNRFKMLKKPVHQLESPAEQIRIFEELTIEEQVELLRETIVHVDEIDGILKETIERYLAEDIAGLLELNNRHLADSKVEVMSKFLQRLVQDRNTIMFNRMQYRLIEGNALIAVGALHLPGEEGLLSLLESGGYRLTNVTK